MKDIILKTLLWLGSFVIMFLAAVFLMFIFIGKFINGTFFKTRGRDPFHDSRQHPLNDPNAPRG